MPDSADDLLAYLRERIKHGGFAVRDAFEQLDALICSGGPLPSAWAEPVRELRRVQDAAAPHHPSGPGRWECVICGEEIRPVTAQDGIDPVDVSSYPWVDGVGNPVCDGPPVHMPDCQVRL